MNYAFAALFTVLLVMVLAGADPSIIVAVAAGGAGVLIGVLVIWALRWRI